MGVYGSEKIYNKIYTVNVDIFAMYMFSLNSRFLNIRKNMYTVKITFVISQRDRYAENANFDTREIAHFQKYAKIYTRENIYLYTIQKRERVLFWPRKFSERIQFFFFFFYCLEINYK